MMNINVIVLLILLKFVTHVYFYFRSTVQFLYEEPLWIIISLYISFLILKANQKGLFVENNVSGKALFCVQEGLKKTAGKKYISTRKISNAVQQCYYKSKLVWMKCFNSYVLTCFLITVFGVCLNTGQAYFLLALGKIHRINPVTLTQGAITK